MLSVVIHSELSYSALLIYLTTDTPEVHPLRSSRTRRRSFQIPMRSQQIGAKLSHDVLNPARVPLNGRTAQPLGPTTAPGCDEPTSRCQTASSIWTLGRDQPVIPRVTFIRWATPLPRVGAGSLSPTFVSDRLVGLSVKQVYANTLSIRFPSESNLPLCASVTF